MRLRLVKAWIYSLLLLFVIIIYLAITRCSIFNEKDDYNSSYTLANMASVGSIVALLLDRNVQICNFQTIEEILGAARDRDLISVADYNYRGFRFDHWDHPFTVITKCIDSTILVIIRSRGKNGLDEGGGGDDLVVEIIMKDNSIMITTRSQSGTHHHYHYN
jgi:hypothetical protein